MRNDPVRIGDDSGLAAAPGDQIVLREVYRGRIWTARPVTVASVTNELVAVYVAPGTVFKVPASTHRGEMLERLASAERGWSLEDHVWTRARMLYLLIPGAAHAIHLWWLPPHWRFGGWYINIQEPMRRTPLGYDFMDHVLDVVIDPDLSWRWKDEDELAQAIQLGLLSDREADAIRREGHRVIARLEGRMPPFDDGWERWRPDPAWPIPLLPPGWDTDPSEVASA